MVEAARTGRIPTEISINSPYHPTMFHTARDARLVTDYRAEVPEHLQRTAALRSMDPGSLHRVPIAGARPTVAASAYEDLFPAAAENMASQGGFAGGGGHPNGQHSAKPSSPGGGRTQVATAASRSYQRIRFSARVGGVVIGRPPANSDVTLDVVDFDWAFGPDKTRVIVSQDVV